MALDLVHIEDQIKERKSRQKTQKDEGRHQELAKAEATSRRTLAAMLGISGNHTKADNNTPDMLEDTMAEEVASMSNGITLLIRTSSACPPTISTVNTVSQSTSAAIPSNIQPAVLSLTPSPSDAAQSSGLSQLKQPLNMPAPS